MHAAFQRLEAGWWKADVPSYQAQRLWNEFYLCGLTQWWCTVVSPVQAGGRQCPGRATEILWAASPFNHSSSSSQYWTLTPKDMSQSWFIKANASSFFWMLPFLYFHSMTLDDIFSLCRLQQRSPLFPVSLMVIVWPLDTIALCHFFRQR